MDAPYTSRQLTSSGLIEEVGQWAKRNFQERRMPETSLLGLMEEIGETSHCVLKRIQKIRGFDQDAHFLMHIRDGMADFMIYLADFAHMKGVFFSFNHNDSIKQVNFTDLTILAQFMLTLAALYNLEERTDVTMNEALKASYTQYCQRLCSLMECWARMHNVGDLQEITNDVWCRVSARDWQKNPANADKVVQ